MWNGYIMLCLWNMRCNMRILLLDVMKLLLWNMDFFQLKILFLKKLRNQNWYLGHESYKVMWRIKLNCCYFHKLLFKNCSWKDIKNKKKNFSKHVLWNKKNLGLLKVIKVRLKDKFKWKLNLHINIVILFEVKLLFFYLKMFLYVLIY